MQSRKGFNQYLLEMELKWVLLGVAIGLGLGFLMWEQNMNLIGTVQDILSPVLNLLPV